MTALKEMIVNLGGLTRGSLLRKLTTAANKYSRAVVVEKRAKGEKAGEREKILAIMDSLGTDDQDLARFHVLVLETGGEMDYSLAQKYLSHETLNAVTTHRIDEDMAAQVLDADTLAKIRVPVVDPAKARKHLDKPTIKSIILSGTTTLKINVNAKRAK